MKFQCTALHYGASIISKSFPDVTHPLLLSESSILIIQHSFKYLSPAILAVSPGRSSAIIEPGAGGQHSSSDDTGTVLGPVATNISSGPIIRQFNRIIAATKTASPITIDSFIVFISRSTNLRFCSPKRIFGSTTPLSMARIAKKVVRVWFYHRSYRNLPCLVP